MSQSKVLRLALFVGSLGVVVAACGGTIQDDPAQGDATSTTQTTEATTVIPAQSVFPDGPSALSDPSSPEFPPPLVDPGEIISGGPPPDGIPPIDEPVFLPVSTNLALLDADEPVVALEINGDARAYPVSVMIWHEIVNDTVGQVPVAVTYCPLCNSAVTYGREINGAVTTFGTSGRLFASALVMYDRATESLWTHFDGRAVVGLLTGTQLDVYGSPLMSWSEFRTTYPDGQVLDQTATGFSRSYGTNPYVGYDDPDSRPFLFAGDVDARARAKERVIGVARNGVDVAYSLQSIEGDAATVTPVTQGGEDLVILWVPGQASALEDDSIAGGRDVGSVGVFVPAVGDRTLTLEAAGDGFIDAETGSEWSVAGVAIKGELAGSSLERVPHLDTFWFAWATYRPGSELVGSVG